MNEQLSYLQELAKLGLTNIKEVDESDFGLVLSQIAESSWKTFTSKASILSSTPIVKGRSLPVTSRS